jgi:hypothetical protein
MVTISPELMVNAGLSAGLKCPICTVCGLGISEYSVARAYGNANTNDNRL